MLDVASAAGPSTLTSVSSSKMSWNPSPKSSLVVEGVKDDLLDWREIGQRRYGHQNPYERASLQLGAVPERCLAARSVRSSAPGTGESRHAVRQRSASRGTACSGQKLRAALVAFKSATVREAGGRGYCAGSRRGGRAGGRNAWAWRRHRRRVQCLCDPEPPHRSRPTLAAGHPARRASCGQSPVDDPTVHSGTNVANCVSESSTHCSRCASFNVSGTNACNAVDTVVSSSRDSPRASPASIAHCPDSPRAPAALPTPPVAAARIVQHGQIVAQFVEQRIVVRELRQNQRFEHFPRTYSATNPAGSNWTRVSNASDLLALLLHRLHRLVVVLLPHPVVRQPLQPLPALSGVSGNSQQCPLLPRSA